MNVETLIPIIVTAIITSLCSLGIQVILNKRSRNIEVLKERLIGVYVPFYLNSSRHSITIFDDYDHQPLLDDLTILINNLHFLDTESQERLLEISYNIDVDGPPYLDNQFFDDYLNLRKCALKEYRFLCKTLKYPVPKIKF